MPLRGIPPLRALLAAPLRGGAVGVISNEKKTEGVRCRLKKGGTTFEVLCHTAKVELFREGTAAQAGVLVAPDLFKDIKTGDRPSADEVEKAFGHADLDKAVEEVLLNRCSNATERILQYAATLEPKCTPTAVRKKGVAAEAATG